MASYKIKKGDTLSAIAKANNTTVDALVKANNIKNKNLIVTGKSLTIPGKSQVKTPGANRTGDKIKKSSGTPAAVSGRKVQTTPSKPKGRSIGGSGTVTVTGRDGKKYTANYGTKPITLGSLPKAPAGSVTTRTGAVEAGRSAKFNYGSKPINVTSSKPKPGRKPTAQEIKTAQMRAGGNK